MNQSVFHSKHLGVANKHVGLIQELPVLGYTFLKETDFQEIVSIQGLKHFAIPSPVIKLFLMKSL